MWFIGVQVEQEMSAPRPKKNPGSAPVLKNTTASMSSTIDEIEDALMSLKDVKLKYNSQRNIVKEVLNL